MVAFARRLWAELPILGAIAVGGAAEPTAAAYLVVT
jgi:hypothetical protein